MFLKTRLIKAGIQLVVSGRTGVI